MPLQATSGAATYDAFGGGVAAVPNYIEDVFSTYLYTGNAGASNNAITNGIDLSTKGGLTWIKNRASAVSHYLFDTERGMSFAVQSPSLSSNTTNAQSSTLTDYIRADTTGFTLGTGATGSGVNASSTNYASWTFRKQPKFFDIVTYTGNGTAGRTISHNLGSTPGCIIVKCTSASAIWSVYHRSTGATKVGILNDTNAFATVSAYWNDTEPTSTVFTVGGASAVNDSGQTYVAYLFAHDAGGFGLTGTDNVISCGSFTNSGSTVDVNLGYEAQFVLMKKSSGTGNWFLFDTMRGMAQTSFEFVYPNLSGAAEFKDYQGPFATATGFSFNPVNNGQFSGGTYIYIAIRRGPMKVPTSGTSVFSTSVSTSNSGLISSGFATDFVMALDKTSGTTPYNRGFSDRLRGNFKTIGSSVTDVEDSNATTITFDSSNGIILNGGGVYSAGYVYEQFRRAPSFFDEVCYTGNSVQGRTITHNLGVKPELMFVKSRSNAISWQVYSATETATKYMLLDSSQSSNTASFDWNNTEPTSSVFTIQGTGGTGLEVNWTGYTYVAYLFATCPGVSKVGSYTGTGTTLQVDCGFTGGARFVLIKRTDSTGDWYLWDSARGIVAGNDPYLLMNTNAAQVTNTDYVDTYSAGFEISSTAPSAINASGGTFIFLAIA